MRRGPIGLSRRADRLMTRRQPDGEGGERRRWVTVMFWYGHGLGGWGWFVMSAGVILFWALIIALGVVLYRFLAGPREGGDRAGERQPVTSPEQLLAARFARGEIDEDEYRRRLAVLREGSHEGPPPRPGRR
ncbi:SHOCT domain-containing protein [Streptomyces capoamus]|uniref:SHOCT domain-containing protein n=1 Tax=Streptomyces capoamus TaxID=68183 RepID=UPI003EB77533